MAIAVVEVQVLSSACEPSFGAALVFSGRVDASRRSLYPDGEHTFDHPRLPEERLLTARQQEIWNYLVEYVDWRLIFFINVPVGIAGTVAALILLPKFGPTPVGRFDVLGFVTVAGGTIR